MNRWTTLYPAKPVISIFCICIDPRVAAFPLYIGNFTRKGFWLPVWDMINYYSPCYLSYSIFNFIYNLFQNDLLIFSPEKQHLTWGAETSSETRTSFFRRFTKRSYCRVTRNRQDNTTNKPYQTRKTLQLEF